VTGYDQTTMTARRVPIPRCHAPSREHFLRAYARSAHAVVLTGVTEDWPARSSWTPDRFSADYGTLRVPVEVWCGRQFSDVRRENMLLSEYVTVMREGEHNGCRRYLAGYPIFTHLPELERDMSWPRYIDRSRALAPYLSMGAPGTATPLHYDISHNLYVQLMGRKRVVLVSHSYAHNLYHPSLLDPYWWGSRVDIDAPDLARFPRFADVELLETVLEPGEMLFIPGRFRHALWSIDETVSLALFWEHTLAQTVVRRLLRLIGRPSV
jgi:hypothetical protein